VTVFVQANSCRTVIAFTMTADPLPHHHDNFDERVRPICHPPSMGLCPTALRLPHLLIFPGLSSQLPRSLSMRHSSSAHLPVHPPPLKQKSSTKSSRFTVPRPLLRAAVFHFGLSLAPRRDPRRIGMRFIRKAVVDWLAEPRRAMDCVEHIARSLVRPISKQGCFAPARKRSN
jgi:hypothetical protein